MPSKQSVQCNNYKQMPKMIISKRTSEFCYSYTLYTSVVLFLKHMFSGVFGCALLSLIGVLCNNCVIDCSEQILVLSWAGLYHKKNKFIHSAMISRANDVVG